MFILNVIPISRGITKESLSYFSSVHASAGTIAMVPLRKRIIPALVISSRPAQESKLDIRSSDYALKKVSRIESHITLSPAFLYAVQQTADYFASSAGAVLSATIPKFVFENIKKVAYNEKTSSGSTHEKLVLQTNDEERFAHYKSIIREEFARKRSIYFTLPTIEGIRERATLLEKGIQEFTFILHSKISPKELLNTVKKIKETDHPILIIGTPQFISLARADVLTIILDEESSRNYKIPTRPYLDMRYFIEKYAEKVEAKFILGDLLLRTETIYETREGKRVEILPLKMRAVSDAEHLLVDMKKVKPNLTSATHGKKVFRVLSPELEDTIRYNKENHGRLFLFGARKGFATEIVCDDCGEIVRCNNCGAPMVLYSLNVKENYFFCNKCGEKRDATERCATCNSWDLTSLGIGTERIEAEVKEYFPDVKVFRIDKESVPTEKKALDMISKFLATPGSILIGTELALIYLKERIENTAIVSIDSLFAVPDFRISEKLFHIILEVRDRATQRFILQTRNIQENLYQLAMAGNLVDFYRNEINDRKRFSYPPFSVFIKITLEGTKARVEKEIEDLKQFLAPNEADFFSSSDKPKIRNFTMHALLKVSEHEWPKKDLLEKLRALPPQYRIKVDPDTLL